MKEAERHRKEIRTGKMDEFCHFSSCSVCCGGYACGLFRESAGSCSNSTGDMGADIGLALAARFAFGRLLLFSSRHCVNSLKKIFF